jgi:hypothetical protein
MATQMSNFGQVIDKMVRDRDSAFLERVAQDYNLDLKELQAKYLETAETVVKVKRPYKKREPKMVEITNENGEKVQVPVKKEAEEGKDICKALTSKKEPCKFSALKGGCFCKRHQRQHDEEQSGEPSAKKQKKEPEQKQEQPLHTHALDAQGENCSLCESHGNPLNNNEEDFEVVLNEPKGMPSLTVAERLAALLEESDDSESEEELELDPLTGEPVEEQYEEEYEDEE